MGSVWRGGGAADRVVRRIDTAASCAAPMAGGRLTPVSEVGNHIQKSILHNDLQILTKSDPLNNTTRNPEARQSAANRSVQAPQKKRKIHESLGRSNCGVMGKKRSGSVPRPGHFGPHRSNADNQKTRVFHLLFEDISQICRTVAHPLCALRAKHIKITKHVQTPLPCAYVLHCPATAAFAGRA